MLYSAMARVPWERSAYSCSLPSWVSSHTISPAAWRTGAAGSAAETAPGTTPLHNQAPSTPTTSDLCPNIDALLVYHVALACAQDVNHSPPIITPVHIPTEKLDRMVPMNRRSRAATTRLGFSAQPPHRSGTFDDANEAYQDHRTGERHEEGAKRARGVQPNGAGQPPAQ